jgi:uncharacterized protein
MSSFVSEGLPPTVIQLLKSVETRQKDNDRAHGSDHVRRVVMNCRAIFREIECRQEVVLLAACLHDTVSRHASDSPGESSNRSAEQAGLWLQPLGVTQSNIEEVSTCIRTASWEHYARGGVPANPEAYVLRDADLLESIGARGIARTFAFAGEHRLGLEWTNIDIERPKMLTPNIDQLESPFQHFESKLLWVTNIIFSKTAKAEAEIRHKFMLQFLHRYKMEVDW